jgi:hypothetical protein
MYRRYFRLLQLAVLLAVVLWQSQSLRPVVCRDPDVGGTAQNKDRKFMILGSEDSGGAGIGNLLIFFPAAFYFAAVTGRDIVITDNSVLGEMCNIVHCGFPFVSQLKLAFPHIHNDSALRSAENLRFGDFLKYMEGSKKVTTPLVRAGGYQSKSDWWVWFNTTVHCVSRITGCDLGDVMCAERHAYQRLIRGPFKTGFTEREDALIHGVPDDLKHALLTLPHSYAPRLDMAVHLRAQFDHFEQQTHHDDPAFRMEVATWLNSTERTAVFEAMRDRIILKFQQLKPNVKIDGSDLGMDYEPVFIYLAADNAAVKEAFSVFLMSHAGLEKVIRIMKVDSQSIYHVKNFANFKKATNNEGLLDLVFDWYALSLANEIYAWRKGGTNMISTFVHAAQKLSGTTERSDNNNGNGIGTRGYQLIRDKRGNMKFDLFWAYSFVEDYQKI